MQLRLKIMGVLASVLLMLSGASAECTLNEITLDSTVPGSWSSDCNSTNRPASYAQYYTFTLIGTEAIKIDLESPTDTYLYLLADANISGMLITSDDDGGEGLNSRIFSELSAGTYTIEATTFSSSQLGDFNLTLSKSTLVNYSLEGTVDLPAQILALIESCTDFDCPSMYISASAISPDGNYQSAYAQVDYNDTTDKYVYQLDLIGEANTSMDISISADAGWSDPVTGEYYSSNLYYSFGADQAVGGTGSDADYPIDNCDYAAWTALHVDLNTPPSVIEIDLSNYVLPIKSQAVMTLRNVPANTYVYLSGYSENACGVYGWEQYNEDGSKTLTVQDLIDGNEYGFLLYTSTPTTYEEYRLNDNDGDFTNGGVFVEDAVYDTVYDDPYSDYPIEVFVPVFDKTILATPEDIIISAPENLNFGNPALVPTIYLLLM